MATVASGKTYSDNKPPPGGPPVWGLHAAGGPAAVGGGVSSRPMENPMPLSKQSPNWIARLRGLLAQPQEGEHCELCNAALQGGHPHLVDPHNHWVLCACAQCAAMFSEQHGGPYRLVPTDMQRLAQFRMSDAQWNALQIPIGVAFFFYSSAVDRMVALYPGPGGATESMLDAAVWRVLARTNPVLGNLRPDVEAVLVNRVGGAHAGYRLPMDRCYALVEILRLHWSGLDGGAAVAEAVRDFCAGLEKADGGPAWCYA